MPGTLRDLHYASISCIRDCRDTRLLTQNLFYGGNIPNTEAIEHAHTHTHTLSVFVRTYKDLICLRGHRSESDSNLNLDNKS